MGGGSIAGDSSVVATELNGSNPVIKIYSSSSAFAALRADGSVVTWGSSGTGGDSSHVAGRLNYEIQAIYTGISGFVATKLDGSVLQWGGNGISMWGTPLLLASP